jgi:pimeloyl-ACP methyl ester carboxylesterase
MRRLNLIAICMQGSLISAVVGLGAGNYLPERDTPVPHDEQIPTVDFVRPRLFTDPELNPSGTYFAAFTKSENIESLLAICEIESGKLQISNSGVRSFSWIDDRYLLLNDRWNGVIDIKRPRRQLLVSEVLPKDARGLMRETGFMWSWPIEDSPIGARKGRILRWWGRHEDGMPGFCTTLEEGGRMHLYRRVKNKWIRCEVDMDEIAPVALGSGPDEMLVIGPAEKGSPRALQRLDTVTGQLGEVLYRDSQYDCRPSVFLKRDTRAVIGVSVPTRLPRTVWFDDRMKEVQSMVDQQFPGKVVEISSTDIRQNKFAIEVESDREPSAFLMLDYEKKALRLIKRVEPWLDAERMAPMHVLQYKARDGALIDGFLVLPAGASKENPAPVIVEIHAGPWESRNLWGMDRGAQFFASRGYAVFQPNYRGSAGYDSRFNAADRHDFQKMSDDVVDGVHAITKSGLIDPKRVVALGVGFGAYLAMCGAVDEPDLYRCAIIYGGIYDWERLFRKKDSLSMLEDEWLKRRLGEFNLTPPSPWQRRDRIKIPIFMTRNVGIRDYTYDTQIFEFYLEMKNQVPCEFFGDLNIATYHEAYSELVERFDRFEAFLAKYCAVN